MRVIFVCTGNTCRSPMAEALFRKKLQNSEKIRENLHQIEICSAGIIVFQGIPVSTNALSVLAEYGIEFNHKPQRINKELMRWADLVLTMTQLHKYIVVTVFPEILNKTFTLKEFVGEQNSLNINDPVGKSLSKYRQCAEEIDQVLNLLEKKLT